MGHHSWRISLLTLCFPIVLFAATALAQGINEVSSLPIITNHPQGGVVNQGDPVTLTCVARNTNLPILFSHNGLMIDENDPGRIISSSSLSISNFIAGFEGEYVCLARNRVGNNTFTVASAPALVQLRVLEATLFSTVASAPYNVTTTVGRPVIIDCGPSYTSVPAPEFDWGLYRPFERGIIASDNIVIGLNGSLYVRNPTMQQSGLGFQCTITNTPMVQVGYIQLIVEALAPSSAALPPHILSSPSDVATSGGNVQFECIIGGSPLVDITWTTPVPSTRIFLNPVYGGNIIQANVLGRSDAGTFTCSIPSVGNFSAQLAFIEPPRLSAGLPGTTLVVTYGSPLSLNCASDSLAVSWFWFRNGIRLTQFSGPQLQIASTVEADTGSYQCYAVNEAGSVSGATYIEIRTIAPSIEQELPPQRVEFRGTNIFFSCSAFGAPPPTYQWIKDGIPLAESSTQFQMNTMTGSLMIMNVGDSHNGQYMCRATNRIGERIIGQAETSTRLTVIQPTTFTRSLDTEQNMLSIQLGTQDTLFCDVSSDSGSTLQFSWTKDSLPLTVDGTRLVYADSSLMRNGSIRIMNVVNEDAGVYVCTVTTTYNGITAPTISTASTQVMVTDQPVAPTITEASSPSSTTVKVIWSITSNLNLIQSFIVEIRLTSATPGDENAWTSIRRNPNAVTLFIIEDLTPFTSYEVRVSAEYINRGSEVIVGDAVGVTTMEDLPGGPPKEVTIVPISSSGSDLEIKWQPPSQPNGLITNYTILYRLKESSTTNNLTATVGGNITSFILKNLKSQQEYIIQVAASNSVGMGPFSTESMGVTSSGGLREPEGPFYQTVWFIAVITIVILVLIVAIVILVLVIKYKRTHQPTAGKYHVRPQSGYFGGGGVGDMTDDVAHDYLKRPTEMNAFSSPTNSETLDAMLERETIATTLTDHSMPYPSSRGTPQLPNGSTRYMGVGGFGAPEYINPPSFAEATRNKRTSRPQSAASHTDIKSPSEWSVGHNSRTGFISNRYSDPFEKRHFGGDESGPDSSYSVQTYSDGDSEVTDGTEYSHLAGAGQFPRTYHHLQVQTPQNATLV